MQQFDIIVVGSGPGGSSVAYELAGTGARIAVLERGDFIPAERQNWDPHAVFVEKRYRANEEWFHVEAGRHFLPGIHYNVGGNTKMFGAALTRPRAVDFAATQHADGESPAWPIAYDEMEPWLSRAEEVMRVHGMLGEDKGEPHHSRPYHHPAIAHEPYVERLHADLARQGLSPIHMPMGIDLGPGGACIRCQTCDAFPCLVKAKSDAETCLLRPALNHPNVTLMTRTFAHRLVTNEAGDRIVGVEVERGGDRTTLSSRVVVVACGAVNSAALLLRSASAKHPAGLANGSGVVGRNYMVHNAAITIACHPLRPNPSIYQKTLLLNDWYERGPDGTYPLGTAQLVGKVTAPILESAMPRAPRRALDWLARHSHEWWLLAEDLPRPGNRIEVGADGQIRLHYTPNNGQAMEGLARSLKKALKGIGFPIVLHKRMGVETTSHQAGTVRFGHDPKSSAINAFCLAHEVDNLYVVDASFFPSLPAMGPTLTIVAQGLRVANHINALR